MKSKKVTMLAAALVVAVVAAAGIGYATQYTAQTSNAGNTVDSTFFVMSEDGADEYVNFLTEDLYFHTVTTSSATKYIPVYTHSIANDIATPDTTNGTYAIISSELTLSFDMSNTEATSAKLEVTIDNTFVPVTGMVYTMVLLGANVDDNTNAQHYSAELNTTTRTWTFASISLPAETSTYVVTVYVSITDSTGITPGSGQSIATAGFPTAGSTITFKATAGQA